MKLILGSKSLGRREVLQKAGYKFEIMVANINEEAIRDKDFELLPLLIARGKTKALLPRISEDSVLITSDQIVVCNGELREKPKNIKQATEWLRSYSYFPLKAVTAVVVTNAKIKVQEEGIDIVNVHFRKIPDNVIQQLLSQKRVLQTAGACIGEDPLLNPYISRLEGDMDSLTGLPMKLTQKLLKKVGFMP